MDESKEDPDDDPWGFLPTSRPAPISGGARQRSRLSFGLDDESEVGKEAFAAKPADSRAVPDTEKTPDPAIVAADTQADVTRPAQPVAPRTEQPAPPIAPRSESPVAPEPTETPQAALRRRARPMAIALAGASLAGLLTEVVGNSQLMTLAGPDSMIAMYPLSGLGLLLVVLAQFRDLDARARLSMLRAVNLVFAGVLILALLAVATSTLPAVAIGVIWLCADQLNFLIPLLIWAAAGDEFNVAEGRKIFGWMITWTYLGQVIGLGVASVSPTVMDPLGIPLYWLLIADPIICLTLGLWLPRALAGRATAHGLRERSSYRKAFTDAFEFIWEIPAWRALMWATLLTFVAGISIHLAYTMGVGQVVGTSAGSLQMLFAATNLGALLICWAISRLASERILERLGIPQTMLILPIAAVLAGIVVATGAWRGSLPLLIIGITIWRIPKISLDENARRAALSLVPDQRRARVTFLITLGPLALGLLASGIVAGIALLLGVSWIGPAIAALIAAAAIPFGIMVIKRWEDSMLSWRIRRRKIMRNF